MHLLDEGPLEILWEIFRKVLDPFRLAVCRLFDASAELVIQVGANFVLLLNVRKGVELEYHIEAGIIVADE